MKRLSKSCQNYLANIMKILKYYRHLSAFEKSDDNHTNVSQRANQNNTNILSKYYKCLIKILKTAYQNTTNVLSK